MGVSPVSFNILAYPSAIVNGYLNLLSLKAFNVTHTEDKDMAAAA